jgi:hypothetical protein
VRVILACIIISGAAFAGGFALRKSDRLASTILFIVAAIVSLVLIGAFFGWFGASEE